MEPLSAKIAVELVLFDHIWYAMYANQIENRNMRSTLPESLAKGLREIAVLPDETFGKLLAFLEAIPTEIKQNEIFNAGKSDAGEGTFINEAVTSAAFSIVMSRVGSRLSVEQFVERIIDGISPSAELEDAQRQTLRRRAAEILSVKSLDLVARAHDVLLEHSQTFSTARIVSDLRAIFSDDVSADPQGMVIVHMLNIAYRSAGRRDAFVVALDEKDVDQFLEVLQRAKDKGATLKRAAENAGIPYIKVA